MLAFRWQHPGTSTATGSATLVIGAPGGSYAGQGAGYVLFGRSDGFTSPIDLDDVGDGIAGFQIFSGDDYDRLGFSVSSAGDVNGDGIDDLAIGAPGFSGYYSYDVGLTYIVFGSKAGFDPLLDLSSLDGSNGFVCESEFRDHNGRLVSAAGDLNGDGLD